MNCVVCHVDKKWLLLTRATFRKIHGALRISKDLLGVAVLLKQLVQFSRVMKQHIVEALFLRGNLVVTTSHMPLAIHGRSVPRLLKRFAKRDPLLDQKLPIGDIIQRKAIYPLLASVDCEHVVEMIAWRILSREDGASRGSTIRGIHVALIEDEALRGQLVNVGSHEIIAPVARPVAPAHVVDKQNDEIGLFPRTGFPYSDKYQQE